MPRYTCTSRPQTYPPPSRDQPIDVYAQDVAKQGKRNRTDSDRSYMSHLDYPLSSGRGSSDLRLADRYYEDGVGSNPASYPPLASDLAGPESSRYQSQQSPFAHNDYSYTLPQLPSIPGPSPSSGQDTSLSRAPGSQPTSMRLDDTGDDSVSAYRHPSEAPRILAIPKLSAQYQDAGPNSHAILVKSSGKSQIEGCGATQGCLRCHRSRRLAGVPPCLDVHRTDTDSFGNAGLTTFRAGMDVRFMEYWGKFRGRTMSCGYAC